MEKISQPPIEELFQESYRQVLHIGFALFIIPLRWFGFWYAIEIAIFAFFWNLIIMPRWFKDSFRPLEKQKGYSTGMLVYPISILVMAVIFPLPIMAAGWAVLSVSDGFATLFGKLLGKRHLPWNKNKTWIGTFSFWISAAIFGWLAIMWTAKNMDGSSIFSHQFTGWLMYARVYFLWPISEATAHIEFFLSYSLQDPYFLLVASFIAAAGAAMIESLPIAKLDDNLVAPLCFSLFILLIFTYESLYVLYNPIVGQ